MKDLNDANEVLAQLVVKNTFLTVDLARSAGPRSASVPAWLRLAGAANRGRQPPKSISMPTCSSNGASPRSDLSLYWGDSSTEEGCSVAAEVSTEADASERGDVLSVDLEQVFTGGSPSWKTGVVLAQMLADPGAIDAMVADEEDLLASAQPPLHAVPEPPLALASASHVRLSAKAKAWVPTGGTLPGPFRPPEIQCQLLALVSFMKAILAGTDYVQGVEAKEGPLGWCIVAQVPSQDIHRKEQLLGLAKEALLQAAEKSETLYVLGYRWRPFVTTPLGFSAVLAGVRDPNQACWGLLKSGICRDGGCCRWEHPISNVTINVMVKLAEAVVPPVPAAVASAGAVGTCEAGVSAGSKPGKTRLALSVLCA